MFKVTEILKGSHDHRSYMQYQKNGSAAGTMVCVGQILEHRTNSLEDLVQCDGLIVEVVSDVAILSTETFATSTIMSDLDVLEKVLSFVRARSWGDNAYRYRKLVIQF